MALCDKIDSARLKACIDSTGGIAQVWIANWEDVESYTVSTTPGATFNKVSAINMVTASPTPVFYNYQFGKNTGEVNDTYTKTEENGTAGHTTELKLRFFKNTQPNFDQLQALLNNEMAVIFEDLNGLYWVLGEKRGVTATAAASSYGKLVSDFNGTDLTFTATERAFPREIVNLAVITAVI
jgi:hypothetical protein